MALNIFKSLLNYLPKKVVADIEKKTNDIVDEKIEAAGGDKQDLSKLYMTSGIIRITPMYYSNPIYLPKGNYKILRISGSSNAQNGYACTVEDGEIKKDSSVSLSWSNAKVNDIVTVSNSNLFVFFINNPDFPVANDNSMLLLKID